MQILVGHAVIALSLAAIAQGIVGLSPEATPTLTLVEPLLVLHNINVPKGEDH